MLKKLRQTGMDKQCKHCMQTLNVQPFTKIVFLYLSWSDYTLQGDLNHLHWLTGDIQIKGNLQFYAKRMLHLLPEYCCAIGLQNEIQYAQIVQHINCIPTFSSLARFVLYSLKACFFSFIFFNAPYLGSLTIILIALSHDEFDGTSYSQYITKTFSITLL